MNHFKNCKKSDFISPKAKITANILGQAQWLTTAIPDSWEDHGLRPVQAKS
jgi:hypothetical protein